MNLGYRRRRPDAAAGDAGRRRRRCGWPAGRTRRRSSCRPGHRHRARARRPVGAGRCRRRTTCSSICRRRAPARRRGGSARARSTPRRAGRARACSAARFVDEVEFRETRAGGEGQAGASSAWCARPTLETKLQSGLGTIDRATFTDGVSVQDGAAHGQGPDDGLRRRPGHDRAVVGRPAPTGFVAGQRRAREHRGRARSTGRSTARAWWPKSNVKSVLKPRQRRTGAPRRARPVKRPCDADARDQPINVTAEHLIYNQQTGHAEYTGDASSGRGRRRSGPKTITLDEADRQPDRQGHRAIGDARRGQGQLEVRGDDRRTAKAGAATGPAAPRRPAAAAARGGAATAAVGRRGAAAPRRRGQARAAGQRASRRRRERHHRHGQRAGLRRRRAARHATPARRAWSASRAICAASGIELYLRRVGPRPVASRRLRRRCASS